MKRICWIVLILLMTWGTTQPAQRIVAAGDTCLQFTAENYSADDDSKTKTFVADPVHQTIQPFPENQQPYPVVGESVGLTIAKASAITYASSNNGKQIAFVRKVETESEQFELGVINADGSNLRTVPIDGANISSLSWSADGKYIAAVIDGTSSVNFIQTNNLYATSNSPYRILGPFEWSSQGHNFVTWSVQSDSSVVWLRSVESDLSKEFRSIIDYFDLEVRWSPDGRYVALIVPYPNLELTVNIYGIDGSSMTIPGPIPFGRMLDPVTEWSPDSRYLSFVRPPEVSPASDSSFQDSLELVSIDVQTKQVKIITPHIFGQEIVFSPSHDRMAVPILEESQIALLITNAEGSKSAVIDKKAASNISQMSWSPDGKFIAFAADLPDSQHPENSEQNHPQLIWARSDGSQVNSLSFSNILILKWEMDKNLLLIFAGDGDDNRVLAVNLTTGRTYPLTEAQPQLLYSNTADFGRWNIYSGPRRRIVVMTAVVDFESAGEGGGIEEGTGASVFLAAWDGSTIKTLETLEDPRLGAVRWTSDGMMFAYGGEHDNPFIRFYDAEGQQIWDADLLQHNAHTPGYTKFIVDSLVWIPCLN